MIIQTKYKSSCLSILLMGLFNFLGIAQPGYPSNGFVISFNVDFIDFPDSLNSENLRARYLDTTLTILFVDSTKSFECDTLLRFKCAYRVLSVDTNNIAKLIVYVGSSYGLEECYADELIIKRDTTNSLVQNNDVFYWYSGTMIFMTEGKIKQFVFRNIPDGSWFDIQNIDFSKSKEFILIPPFCNIISYGEDNIKLFGYGEVNIKQYRNKPRRLRFRINAR